MTELVGCVGEEENPRKEFAVPSLSSSTAILIERRLEPAALKRCAMVSTFDAATEGEASATIVGDHPCTSEGIASG